MRTRKNIRSIDTTVNISDLIPYLPEVANCLLADRLMIEDLDKEIDALLQLGQAKRRVLRQARTDLTTRVQGAYSNKEIEQAKKKLLRAINGD